MLITCYCFVDKTWLDLTPVGGNAAWIGRTARSLPGQADAWVTVQVIGDLYNVFDVGEHGVLMLGRDGMIFAGTPPTHHTCSTVPTQLHRALLACLPACLPGSYLTLVSLMLWQKGSRPS